MPILSPQWAQWFVSKGFSTSSFVILIKSGVAIRPGLFSLVEPVAP